MPVACARGLGQKSIARCTREQACDRPHNQPRNQPRKRATPIRLCRRIRACACCLGPGTWGLFGIGVVHAAGRTRGAATAICPGRS